MPDRAVIAVTIDTLPGYEVREVFGQVLGAAALPQNAFSAGVRELPGQHGSPAPRVLTKWREEAVARMVRAAHLRGANAVLGMRFDHRTIDTGWIEICAYGTAVFVLPARP